MKYKDLFIFLLLFSINPITLLGQEMPDTILHKPNSEPLHIKFKSFGIDYYEGLNNIDATIFQNKLKQDIEAYEQFLNGRSIRSTSMLIGIPSGFVFGFNIGKWLADNDTKVNPIFTLASGLGVVISIAMDNIGKKEMIAAVSKFNTNAYLGISIGPSVSENGIGFKMTF